VIGAAITSSARARKIHSGSPAFRRPSINNFAFACPPRAMHADIVKAGSRSSRRVTTAVGPGLGILFCPPHKRGVGSPAFDHQRAAPATGMTAECALAKPHDFLQQRFRQMQLKKIDDAQVLLKSLRRTLSS
jgi:hypothetical protein